MYDECLPSERYILIYCCLVSTFFFGKVKIKYDTKKRS